METRKQAMNQNQSLVKAITGNDLNAVKRLLNRGATVGNEQIRNLIIQKKWDIVWEILSEDQHLSNYNVAYVESALGLLLQGKYGINIRVPLKSDNFIDVLRKMYQVAHDLEIYKNRLNKSKSQLDLYNEMRKKLGEYLEEAVRENMYPLVEYLIKSGAPITYKDGKIFSEYVGRTGFNSIYIIDADRLTYYMKDETRAYNLISAIIDYHDSRKQYGTLRLNENMKTLINYLTNNDNNTNKSDAYSLFDERLADNPELHKFFLSKKLI